MELASTKSSFDCKFSSCGFLQLDYLQLSHKNEDKHQMIFGAWFDRKSRRLLWPMAFAASIALTNTVHADFVETLWTVDSFTGEQWFVDADALIGQTQSFEGGFAEGVFYGCDYAGQSMTYSTYANDDFFANPEFALFAPYRDAIAHGSEQVFVHRITCEGEGNPAKRRVLYPFVTNEAHKSAWYLFEGGVFSLSVD